MLTSTTNRAGRKILAGRSLATGIGRTGSHVPVNLQGDPQGLLVMEDGSVHTGYVFGANRSVAGEVVFTTNMVGYPESMTDPSFAGQILNLTYPMIGNYGIPGKDLDEHGLFKHFESKQIQCEALLISDYSHKHSHWNASQSLSEWMQDHDVQLLRYAKQVGFSDKQIAGRVGENDITVRDHRKRVGITPIVKQIDTLAAEFPAVTNYLFMTYNAKTHDIEFDEHGTLVIGSGVYRIGSSVEFDYSSVECIRTLRELGEKTIALNYNPETVSTDYDESDRLYFEEISDERVMDIVDVESAKATIVSVGGQAPNNMALKLHQNGVNILGTHPEMIDRCEDRNKYSSMLDEIGVKQPAWSALTSMDDAYKFCDDHGYPVLIRPSYVLSGAAMNVAYDRKELDEFLGEAVDVSPDHPVVMTKFLHGAIEVDVDGVAENGELKAYAVSEHVEKGGTHSGDATLVLPAHRISDDVVSYIKNDTAKIAKALEITGPFNTQFLVKDDWIGVIETNLRASRSVPFVSKVLDVPFIKMATKAMLNKADDFKETLPFAKECDAIDSIEHCGVKSPQFSFKRLLGADPRLGVEMSSTGEVACFGKSVSEAWMKSLISAGFNPPNKGDAVLMTAPTKGDAVEDFVSVAKNMSKLGFEIVASDDHTSQLLGKNHVKSRLDSQVETTTGDLSKAIRHDEVTLVMELSNEDDRYPVRRGACDFNISLMTDMEQAKLLCEALAESPALTIDAHEDYFGSSYKDSTDKFIFNDGNKSGRSKAASA